MSDIIMPQIQVGKKIFTRVRVTAKLHRATIDNTPQPILDNTKAVAEKLWWQDGENPDLCFVQFILDAEGGNDNNDYMPRSRLIESFASAQYKPFDMDHVVKEEGSMVWMDKHNPPVKNTIYGVMVKSALAKFDGTLLTDDEIEDFKDTPDDLNRKTQDKVTVVAWAALWNFLFPQTVATLLQEVDNGNMQVSMERWMEDFDFMVWQDDAYSSVTKADASDLGISERWAQRQKMDGHSVIRRCLKYVYGGAASTGNPAQPLSKFIAPSVVQATADAGDAVIMENLVKRHGELHEEWVVSNDREQSSLSAEHARVTRAIAALIDWDGTAPDEIDNSLDQQLPRELHGVVTCEGTEDPEPGTAKTPENIMPQPEAPTIDLEAVKATARSEAEALLKDEKNTAAIADKISTLTADKAAAVQEAATSKTKAETAIQQIQQEMEGFKTQLAEATKKITTLETERDELKKSNATLTEAKAASDLKILDAENAATVASRQSTLKDLGEKVATEARIARASAKGDDGKLTMSDEQFTAWITDIRELTGAATETPTPDDGAEPGDEESDELLRQAIEADAARDKPNPFLEKLKKKKEMKDKKSKANVDTDDVVTPPATPDLSLATDGAIQAVAAMMQGDQANVGSVDGRKRMAAVFGAI